MSSAAVDDVLSAKVSNDVVVLLASAVLSRTPDASYNRPSPRVRVMRMFSESLPRGTIAASSTQPDCRVDTGAMIESP